MKALNLARLDDVQSKLTSLHDKLEDNEKSDIYTYNVFWKPFIRANNWLSDQDIRNLLYLTDLEVVRDFKKGTEKHYIVRKHPPTYIDREYSVSVVIPAKNEAGTISRIIERMPKLGKKTELIFVIGASTDDTYAAAVRAKRQFGRSWPIIIIDQGSGKGKGDAVRRGLDRARGDIVIIFDADMSMDPDDLPKFYHALRLNKGELVMGNRLVYPLEKDSMRALNIIGNKFFALLFTWLLNQPIRDTLCGTKAMLRKDYQRVVRLRSYFGTGDPFGDFDLILGAAKLNMKIIEIPIRYKARVYGKTNIRRFLNGLQLLHMSFTAAAKIKFKT